MASGLWGITTFFNPGGSETRLVNYHLFRQESRRQRLRLVTVELAFGDEPFQLRLGVDAEVLLQKRSTSVLWQKERLLNLALNELPPDCRSVCWVDADVLFADDDWIAQCEALLEKSVVIQPFSAAIRLPKGGRAQDYPPSAVGRRVKRGRDDGTYSESICCVHSRLFRRFSGTTGYAWCARRSLLDACGFYDRCIVGGGDREFALATMYAPGRVPRRHTKIRHHRLREHLRPWHARINAAVAGRVSYGPGVIQHLWHGEAKDRGYAGRHAIMEDFDFDPEADLALDSGGCWCWSTQKSGLVEAVSSYFASRKEAHASPVMGPAP